MCTLRITREETSHQRFSLSTRVLQRLLAPSVCPDEVQENKSRRLSLSPPANLSTLQPPDPRTRTYHRVVKFDEAGSLPKLRSQFVPVAPACPPTPPLLSKSPRKADLLLGGPSPEAVSACPHRPHCSSEEPLHERLCVSMI